MQVVECGGSAVPWRVFLFVFLHVCFYLGAQVSLLGLERPKDPRTCDGLFQIILFLILF